MAGTTANSAFPYPNNADAPNIAGDFAALANSLDGKVGTLRGTTVIAGAEARTNTAYGLLATPDRVSNVIVPANAIVAVTFQAYWKSSTSAAGRAALFVGASQVQYMNDLGEQPEDASTTGTAYNQLSSSSAGMVSSADSGGDRPSPTAGVPLLMGPGQVSSALLPAGPLWIWHITAGTYDFSVQFKSAAGSVTVKERTLKVIVWP